jgi:hypothetical protein
MSDTCDFEDLDCPEPENYAAVAKQLHETALEAEQRIYCMEALLRSAVNRPTYVATTTVDMGPFSSSSGLVPGGVFIFVPGTTAMTVNFANFVAPTYSNGWVLPTGVWHVGAFVATFSVGAANDNTYRQLRILRSNTNPDDGSVFTLDEVAHTAFETANGVQILMTASAVFKLEEQQRVVFLFRHGNTSSNVSIATGAIVWFTKLSDADVIKVI